MSQVLQHVMTISPGAPQTFNIGGPADVRGVFPRQGVSNECRLLRLHGRGVRSSEENSGGEPLKNHVNNPCKIHQELKPGIGQMIADAWSKHERDRRLVSKSAREVLEAMQGGLEGSDGECTK